MSKLLITCDDLINKRLTNCKIIHTIRSVIHIWSPRELCVYVKATGLERGQQQSSIHGSSAEKNPLSLPSILSSLRISSVLGDLTVKFPIENSRILSLIFPEGVAAEEGEQERGNRLVDERSYSEDSRRQ